MENGKNDQKSSVLGKIDDIEAFVDENYGFMSNFAEIREKLIEDMKEYNALLEGEIDKMTLYGDLMRQGHYMEAASLILTPEVRSFPPPRFGKKKLAEQITEKTEVTEMRRVTPKIVCLCGSTRFYEQFIEQNFRETMKGKIVLSVGFFLHRPEMMPIHGQEIGITKDEKKMLDELHMRKIEISDEILVINVGGYIGSSTRRELNYALSLGKEITFLEHEVVE